MLQTFLRSSVGFEPAWDRKRNKSSFWWRFTKSHSDTDSSLEQSFAWVRLNGETFPLSLILRSSPNTLWNVEIVWASPEQCRIDLVEGWNGLKGIVPFDSLFWFQGRVWEGLWQSDTRVRVYLLCNSVLICWVWYTPVNKPVSQSHNGAAICSQRITVFSSQATEPSPTMNHACSRKQSDSKSV